MATDQSVIMISALAAADLSGNQYDCVKITADNTVDAADTAGERVIGLLQNDPDAAGKVASVAVGGVAKGRAGAAITAGSPLQAGADARLEVATTADEVIGIAMTGGADGEIIEVLVGYAGIF